MKKRRCSQYRRISFPLDFFRPHPYAVGMRVLLVNPWIADFAAFDLWAKPLGLLYAGAFLAARGHEVRLLDCTHRFQGPGGYIGGVKRPFGTGKFLRTEIPRPAALARVPRRWCRHGIPVEEFRALAGMEPRPDVILATCVMTYWYPGAFEAVRLCRELFPGVPVALGGVYGILCTDHARRESGADAVVPETLPSRIVGAVERLAGAAGPGPVPDDPFPRWPEPPWHLYERLPAAAVMTSRGCPFSCTVCASRLLAPVFERRDPIEAADAILALAERGVRDVAFADDALLLDAGHHAVPLFERLASAGAPVRLHTPNGLHIREIHPPLARLMKRAGVRTVRLSLETASDAEARARFSGKTSRADFSRAAGALLDAGFSPGDLGAYILVGLPGQSAEEAFEAAAFSHSCGVKVRPALFSSVPGTPEFDRAAGSGMIAPDADPLLHNDTLRAIGLWDGGYARFQRFVREGNARIGGTALE